MYVLIRDGQIPGTGHPDLISGRLKLESLTDASGVFVLVLRNQFAFGGIFCYTDSVAVIFFIRKYKEREHLFVFVICLC